MQTPRLFAILPEDLAATPDGMAVAADGRLIVACPNFADTSKPGCFLAVDETGAITKWADAPPHPGTGLAHPMGIEFGPDGDLYVCDNQGWSDEPSLRFKGRILRLRVRDGEVVRTIVVADGMEHPNGIRIRDGYAYVTQSMLKKVEGPEGLLVSCVYRFGLDEQDVAVTNTLADPHILTTFVTRNRDDQYGADGIVFDHNGDLLVGNFGDGAVHRVVMGPDGRVVDNRVWARDPEHLQTTDGMIVDEGRTLYIADFSANAIAAVTPDGNVRRIAQSPDSDGLDGELDQPGEPIVWNGKLVVSCFDLVTGPGKVNTRHEMPATMAELDLE